MASFDASLNPEANNFDSSTFIKKAFNASIDLPPPIVCPVPEIPEPPPAPVLNQSIELEAEIEGLSNAPIDILFTANGTGDIDLSKGLFFSRNITGVRQGIVLRMRNVAGEWMLNLDDGVDYWGSILGHQFNEPIVRQQFRSALLSAPGVESIVFLDTVFDNASRTLEVSWEVTTQAGVTIEDTLALTV
jgi:hypothetical protein